MNHVSMATIPQFRDVVKNVRKIVEYENQNGNPITIPTLKFHGTVKLHGTNGAICKNSEHFYCQSKNNVLSLTKDNAGFYAFVNKPDVKKYFNDRIDEIAERNDIDLTKNTIAIFGEWAGQGIQKGVGISNLEKTFFVFGIKIKPIDGVSYWVGFYPSFDYAKENIKDIRSFPSYSIDVDFNDPDNALNKMIDMVNEVEESCPVAKKMGHDGIGEGIVFVSHFNDNRLIFKIKGEKHAGKSKVKTNKKTDPIVKEEIKTIVDLVTPEWRMVQMYQETFDTLNGGTGDIKRTGDYINAVMNDIMKEETVFLEECGIPFKKISKFIADKARRYLMTKLNEEIFLSTIEED